MQKMLVLHNGWVRQIFINGALFAVWPNEKQGVQRVQTARGVDEEQQNELRAKITANFPSLFQGLFGGLLVTIARQSPRYPLRLWGERSFGVPVGGKRALKVSHNRQNWQLTRKYNCCRKTAHFSSSGFGSLRLLRSAFRKFQKFLFWHIT